MINRLSKGALPPELVLFLQNERTRRIITEEESLGNREADEFQISSNNISSRFSCLGDLITSVWGGIGVCTVKRGVFVETDVPLFQERATYLNIERPSIDQTSSDR